METELTKSNINKYTKIAKWCAGRVLDYGCNAGHLSLFLVCNRYVGYDVDSFMLSLAKKQYKNRTFTSKILNEKYDVIVMSELLEHVESPLKELKTACSHLDSGGKIVIVIPNVLTFKRWLAYKLGKLKTHPEHICAWTLPEFENLIQKADLSVFHIETIEDALLIILTKDSMKKEEHGIHLR